MHACILCMHAYYACILCMHAYYACMHIMHAYYACMHTMHACILCMHACYAQYACYACLICMHERKRCTHNRTCSHPSKFSVRPAPESHTPPTKGGAPAFGRRPPPFVGSMSRSDVCDSGAGAKLIFDGCALAVLCVLRLHSCMHIRHADYACMHNMHACMHSMHAQHVCIG